MKQDFKYATSNVSICFDDWNPNPDPRNQQEYSDCVLFMKTGEVWKWNNINCNAKGNFICEQSKCKAQVKALKSFTFSACPQIADGGSQMVISLLPVTIGPTSH